MNELILQKTDISKQYHGMLEKIQKEYPLVEKASRVFYKSQSQFMDNMMSIHPLTELRSLRQICAEINKTKMALDEAYFKTRKTKVKIEKLKRKYEMTEDDLDRELIQIEIEQKRYGLLSSQNYIEAAIRKVSAYLAQYQNILKKYGKETFTEEDFEADEARYHVMKAFEQGLCAARSHGGVIDEGNHIYFFQIGISGTAAQYEVGAFLTQEGRLLQKGIIPEHELTYKWLMEMGYKYQNRAHLFAKNKGMTLFDTASMIGE